MEVLYFGTRGTKPGHYLQAPSRHIRGWGTSPDLPFDAARLDGKFPPHDVGERQPEGLANVVHIDGWTVVAFWDRSGDKRYASNSAFLARGTHDFGAMMTAAREQWSRVFERLTFEVRHYTRTPDTESE